MENPKLIGVDEIKQVHTSIKISRQNVEVASCRKYILKLEIVLKELLDTLILNVLIKIYVSLFSFKGSRRTT